MAHDLQKKIRRPPDSTAHLFTKPATPLWGHRGLAGAHSARRRVPTCPPHALLAGGRGSSRTALSQGSLEPSQTLFIPINTAAMEVISPSSPPHVLFMFVSSRLMMIILRRDFLNRKMQKRCKLRFTKLKCISGNPDEAPPEQASLRRVLPREHSAQPQGAACNSQGSTVTCVTS